MDFRVGGRSSFPTRPGEPQFRAHPPPRLSISDRSRRAKAPEASERPAQGTVPSQPLGSGPPDSGTPPLRVPAACRGEAAGRPTGAGSGGGAGNAAAAPASPGPPGLRGHLPRGRVGGREARPRAPARPPPPGRPARPRRALAPPRRARARVPTSPRDFPARTARAPPPPAGRRSAPAAPAEAAMRPARWIALGSLLALAGLLEGRLVGEEEAGFGECDRFFYAGTPPAGLAAEAHVKICQRFEGAERFATLYSRRDRIPVYSAFRAARPAAAGAEPRWLVEPQVSERCPSSGAGL